jgi:hypothetical protein
MAGNLTRGYTLNGCTSGMAGVKSFYVAQTRSVYSITRADGYITGIVMYSGNYFFKYQCQRNTGNFSESYEWKRDIGLRVNNQTATMVVNGMNVSMREELFRLTKYPVLLIVEDRTGAFWLMGETGGAYIDKIDASVGQNGTDRRGQTVSFKAEELQLAAQVNANVMANIYLGDTSCILQDSTGDYLQDSDGSYLSDYCSNVSPATGDFYVIDFDTNDFVI